MLENSRGEGEEIKRDETFARKWRIVLSYLALRWTQTSFSRVPLLYARYLATSSSIFLRSTHLCPACEITIDHNAISTLRYMPNWFCAVYDAAFRSCPPRLMQRGTSVIELVNELVNNYEEVQCLVRFMLEFIIAFLLKNLTEILRFYK